MRHFTLWILFLFMPSLFAAPKGLTENEQASLRLQIFLDEEGYGPGILDARPGWVTNQAYQLYIRRYPERVETEEGFQKLLMEKVPSVTVTAILPRSAEKFVDAELSNDREEQALREDMPYRSILEYAAERYHTTEDFLIKLNGRKVAQAATGGSALVVPRVTPFMIESITRADFKEDKKLSKRSVYIDTEQRRLTVYDFLAAKKSDKESEDSWQIVASFPITPGKDEFIRKGEWKMINCVPWPSWRYDKKLLETGERGEEALMIPGGPNCPVGMLWAGLNKSGIGIHGTSAPRTIGRSRSAGCIRLSNWDVMRLPSFVRPGARVVIR